MRKSVYIAGPITNNPNYKKQFQEAEDILYAMGYTPINPAAYEEEGSKHIKTYRNYINQGLRLLMQCDAIAMLPGSEYSSGARLERKYAETVGMIFIDIKNEMSEDLSDQIDFLRSAIYYLAGESFNINSSKQLGAILFEKMHLPVIKKTSTGCYSTDTEVLEELAMTYEIAALVLEYRRKVDTNKRMSRCLECWAERRKVDRRTKEKEQR